MRLKPPVGNPELCQPSRFYYANPPEWPHQRVYSRCAEPGCDAPVNTGPPHLRCRCYCAWHCLDFHHDELTIAMIPIQTS